LNIQAIASTGTAVEIKSVGVVGAGQMGSGIAQVCALTGFNVWLNDISVDRIESGVARIFESLSRQIAKGLLSGSDRDVAIARVQPAVGYQTFSRCDLVIEAAAENETVKRQIFKALCPFLSPRAIVETNTSSISITA
jgi:3-hydroxybutyryl-CoA dehydrogenase